MDPQSAHAGSVSAAPPSHHPASAGVPPVPDEHILVSRQHLEQLQRHIRLGYERFPTRHLHQSLLIIEHMLARGKGDVCTSTGVSGRSIRGVD